MLPVSFEAPLVNPSPGGLYAITSWADTAAGDPTRWLASGVAVRTHNFGGEAAFGVWTSDWCASPGDLTAADIKDGTRPADGDPFDPITVWAYDECDLTAPSQAEVRARAQQNLRLLEPVAVEREFAARAKIDAGTAVAVTGLTAALSALESALAKTNTVGVIHASPAYAAVASQLNLLVRGGTGLLTPLGHRWCFGGGYADGLGAVLVATSPVFGWRDAVAVREAIQAETNTFAVVAERSVVVGYEKAVGAVTVQ